MIKLTVLVDNHTNDFSLPFLLGESGLSHLIETPDKTILFDTGCGDVFLRNADNLKIDLDKLDMLVLSHGHSDHTWGIGPLVDRLGTDRTRKITLVAHPDALTPKLYNGEQIGIVEGLSNNFDVRTSKDPVWLTEQLCFLGHIPRANGWEGTQAVGQRESNGAMVPDLLDDDSALVYKNDDGLVVITGCAHAGICNIVRYAKKIGHDSRIIDIVGGYHLLDAQPAILKQTGEFLADCRPVTTHPCHCTDLKAKIALSRFVPVEEVMSGLVLGYD